MTRPRAKAIKVYVTPEEDEAIASLAASANLSHSDYLRTAGLHQKVRSVLDVHAVNELSKANGDLGRVAGILKLWLAEQRGNPREVEKIMKEFLELQKRSHEIMGRIAR